MKKFALLVFLIAAACLLGVIATDKIGASLTGEKWEKIVEAQGGEAKLPASDEKYIETIDFTLSQASEGEIIQFMHKMSHQKIKSSDKWGAERMDKATIQSVMKVVGGSSMKHRIVLMDILEKWEGGDFSTADLDHNSLWDIQGGTIGEATDVLTPEEEQKWIDSNY